MAVTNTSLTLKRRFTLLVNIMVCLICLLPTASLAADGLSQGDINSIVGDTPFYDPNSGDDSSCSTSTTSLVGSDNVQKAFNYFVAHGLTAVQAAAIIGNLEQESGQGLNPAAQQDGSKDTSPKDGVGFGIAQWTYTSRQQPLVTLAASENKPVTDLGVQLDYVWQEISPGGNRAGALTALKAQTDVAAATEAFEMQYEAAGKPVMDNRISNAQAVLAQYGGSAVTTSNDGSNSTGASGCSSIVNCNPMAGVSAGLSQIRQNVVCIAQQELATWNAGVQVNDYCRKYIDGPGKPAGGSGGYCEEWCADFTSWVYDQAKYPLKPDPSWRVPAVAGIKAIGEQNVNFHWHPVGDYIPRPGDIVIHENGESHVNIVISVSGTKLTMIGGDQGGPNYGGPNSTSKVSEYQTTSFTSDGISGFVSPD